MGRQVDTQKVAGEGNSAVAVITGSSESSPNNVNHRALSCRELFLFVIDRCIMTQFLVDTGADLCVFPTRITRENEMFLTYEKVLHTSFPRGKEQPS